MSVLASLKLVAAKKPAQLPPVAARRNKLVNRLDEQIELAVAMQEGRSYAPTKIKQVTDANGTKAEVKVAKRITQWWWLAEDGKVYLSLRYGAKVVELGKGKSAVEIGNGNNLVATLEAIKGAIAAGEMDAQIASAAGAVKVGLNK